MLKTGDRVSFINDKLNGIVKQVHDNNMLTIELDDGFDIEVNSGEVVKEGEGMQMFTRQSQQQKKQKQPVDNFNSTDQEQQAEYPEQFAPDGVVALISLPAVKHQPTRGRVIFRIENNTEWSIHVVLSLVKEQKHKVILSAGIRAGKHVATPEFERAELELFQNWHCQFMLYKEFEYDYQKPVSTDIAIELPDWQVSDSNIKGLNSFSRVQIIKEFANTEPDVSRLIEAYRNRKPEEHAYKDNRLQTFAVEMEFDLHWQNTKAEYEVSDTQILNEQIKMFHRVMSDALKKNATSVTFIHGIGDGVLKKALLDALKNYKDAEAYPADESRYGQGATKIVFK